MKGRICISIVSHLQCDLIYEVLQDIYRSETLQHFHLEVVVTINVPENFDKLTAQFPAIKVIKNVRPRGFGDNHNQVFNSVECDLFLVLNPDIRLNSLDFCKCVEMLGGRNVGVVSPRALSPAGLMEDNARSFPTILRISFRVFRRLVGWDIPTDKLHAKPIQRVDWVAGLFMLFKADSFSSVGGFDNAYFMYLEDADICRRLLDKGLKTTVINDQFIIHDARRKTLKEWKYFRLHFSSLLRFFFARVAWRKNKE